MPGLEERNDKTKLPSYAGSWKTNCPVRPGLASKFGSRLLAFSLAAAPAGPCGTLVRLLQTR